MPDTTTIRDRQEYLKAQLAEPALRQPGELTITFRFRAQFVLHMDQEQRVTAFEPLNEDAAALEERCTDDWKGEKYSKSAAAIFEQAIIDGYISDNNPDITILVEQEPGGEDVLLDDIEKKILDKVSQVIELHGISAEIVLQKP